MSGKTEFLLCAVLTICTVSMKCATRERRAVWVHRIQSVQGEKWRISSSQPIKISPISRDERTICLRIRRALNSSTCKKYSSPFFGGDKMDMADIMLILFATRFQILSQYRSFKIPEEEALLKACKEQRSVIKSSCDIDKANLVYFYQSYAKGFENVRKKMK